MNLCGIINLGNRGIGPPIIIFVGRICVPYKNVGANE